MKKIKLLLVYPPITKHERYGSNLGIFGGKQIPLGIFYLAGYVRKHGYEVDAIDAEAQNLTSEDILTYFQDGKFNVLGISATTVAFHRSLELAVTVKKSLQETPVIIGGPHVSSQPSQPLQFDAFDYAVPYEGEETLLELLQSLEDKTSPENIKGIVFRYNNEIRVNPQRAYIKELDTLPFPAYDLIPDLSVYSPPPFNYKQRPVANIITSRGCPNNCTFCERTTFGRKLRMRSPENIADEIELLIKKFGINEIAFVDDTFTVKSERIYEIFDLTRKKGLHFPWTCMSRVDTVDENLLEYMRDNGCWYIAFGIESGDEEILKEIRKKIRLSDVERVVALCNRIGIKTKGFFIVGHPKESLETIDKTIAFAKSLKLDHIVVTVNTPMPGSYQYQHAHEYGTLDESSWSKFNYWNPVFVPYGMTQELLLKKHREFLKKFYLRPERILLNLWKLLTHPNSPQQFYHVISSLYRYFFRERKK